MPDGLPRRDFLKTSAVAAALSAPAILKAQNANEGLNIGWIGVGTRGYAGLSWLHTAEPNGAVVTAIRMAGSWPALNRRCVVLRGNANTLPSPHSNVSFGPSPCHTWVTPNASAT